jgi:hypothetical protein
VREFPARSSRLFTNHANQFRIRDHASRCGANYVETRTLETRNPPIRRAGVPASRGISSDLAVLILPENSNRCKPFLGSGGALPKIVSPLRRVARNPKERSCL